MSGKIFQSSEPQPAWSGKQSVARLLHACGEKALIFPGAGLLKRGSLLRAGLFFSSSLLLFGGPRARPLIPRRGGSCRAGEYNARHCCFRRLAPAVSFHCRSPLLRITGLVNAFCLYAPRYFCTILCDEFFFYFHDFIGMEACVFRRESSYRKPG